MTSISQLDARIKLYSNEITFMKLLPKQLQQEIEQEEYADIITNPAQHYKRNGLAKLLPDHVERIITITLTAKLMIEERTSDERDILYGLTKIVPYLFPDTSKEQIELLTQANREEAEQFLEEYFSIIPKYFPRFDNAHIVLLKVSFIINSMLYLAKSMHEKRFPYGTDFYQFLVFMIHEVFIHAKPFEAKGKTTQRLCNMLKPFLSTNSIIYIFDHYPEKASELAYILIQMSEFPKFSSSELKLLQEHITETIIINKEYKSQLLRKLDIKL